MCVLLLVQTRGVRGKQASKQAQPPCFTITPSPPPPQPPRLDCLALPAGVAPESLQRRVLDVLQTIDGPPPPPMPATPLGASGSLGAFREPRLLCAACTLHCWHCSCSLPAPLSGVGETPTPTLILFFFGPLTCEGLKRAHTHTQQLYCCKYCMMACRCCTSCGVHHSLSRLALLLLHVAHIHPVQAHVCHSHAGSLLDWAAAQDRRLRLTPAAHWGRCVPQLPLAVAALPRRHLAARAHHRAVVRRRHPHLLLLYLHSHRRSSCRCWVAQLHSHLEAVGCQGWTARACRLVHPGQ